MRYGYTRRAAVALALVGALLAACAADAPEEEARVLTPSQETESPSETPALSAQERRAAREAAAEARREERAAARRARERARNDRLEAEEDLAATMEALFSSYNVENFIQASAYVADRFVRKCGGPTDLAFAFTQNKDAERLNYTLDNVKVTDVSGRSAGADVTYSARDDQSGELYDDHFAVGLTFVKNARRDTRWVLNDLFPLGVGAYC